MTISSHRAERLRPSNQAGRLQFSNPAERLRPIWRALIEVAFIVFLFYSNLLMGEFEFANGQGKTLAIALRDIFTGKNFLIALFSATVGYLIFEFLRERL